MRPSKDKREELGNHPGWAVKFVDGSWLGGAHGWFRTDDAAYADVYDSKEEGESNLKYVRKYDDKEFKLDAEVVPAWEPLCETLRYEMKRVREASKISSDDVYRFESSIEEVINTLQYDIVEILKPSKKKSK